MSFAEPVDGQTFASGVDLHVIVDATDSDGTISFVELYMNGVFLRRENSSPYTWQWPSNPLIDPARINMAAGSYTFRTVAHENDGGVAEASITITVVDDTPPPPPTNVPPTADFNFSTAEMTAHFVDASTDSDGSIVARSWDFGDGSTSTATNPGRNAEWISPAWIAKRIHCPSDDQCRSLIILVPR